ncbi:TolC family protein [Anaeromyxobacter paludicola]|uniref:RND transporter n=1 Tax=Anaeromyxobacter paludicola TaxID=2918171 RepID=A0ABM7XAN4_9BACT|nr:TolC family protein [Anaeromyxobacter paludicola]BDG08913.1 RND transporter [Anaeromyxobacter paludicola]
MSLRILALLALLATAPLPGGLARGDEQGVPVWGLEDARAAFLSSSPELREAEEREEAARADVLQAGLRPNPELSLSLGNIPLRANTTPAGNGSGLGRNAVYGAGLSQTFELGGKRGKRVDAAEGALAESRSARSDALRLARFELEKAFWAAVSAAEHRKLAEEVRARHAETIRISRARFEADDIAASDLDRVVLEGARQENDLADARAAEHAAVAELLRLVGAGAPAWVTVKGTLPAPRLAVDAAALVARAGRERPDLAEARARVESARAGVALAEAQAVPDLTAGLSYAHSQAVAAGDNPDTLAATLSLPLPLFHRNQGEVAKARVALAGAERALAALSARAGREVQQAVARHEAAVEKVTRYEGGALERAERSLRAAEKSWREGATSLLTFLEAERTFIAVRADYLDTLYELRVARLELARATGAAALETSS